MSQCSASEASSSHGWISGLPSIVCFINHRLNGSTNLPPRPGGTFAYDDQAAARHKLVPCAAQHRAMIRHGVVRKAEQHAVKRRRRRERGGIALHQLDIVPAIGIAGLLRL